MKRFACIIPIAVAVLVFAPSLHNFFAYDDFIWLYRAKTLGRDWMQMFRPDVMYFDPLVYLTFYASFLTGGLNPVPYHVLDIALHALNSLLVFRLARCFSRDDKGALYAGILFASSCSIADAVIWPSSLVDLIAVAFSLGALIQFLKYLRGDNRRFLLLSLLCYVLALGAKGTPAVLPLMLFGLILQEREGRSRAAALLPFALVTATYLVLVKLNLQHAALPPDRLHLNIHNLALSLSALFIPEAKLTGSGVYGVSLAVFAVVSALALPALPATGTAALRRTGYLILLTGILPVLVLAEFKLVENPSTAHLLLLTPSHRLYLASVGSALLLGGVVESLQIFLTRHLPRAAAAVVALGLAGAVAANAGQVRERNAIWNRPGERYRFGFNGLCRYQGQVSNGSHIALINFPGAVGFSTPMAKLALDLEDVTLIKKVNIGYNDDPVVLANAEKTELFVLGADGTAYNKTEQYRRQLLLNRLIVTPPRDLESVRACRAESDRLTREVNAVLP